MFELSPQEYKLYKQTLQRAWQHVSEHLYETTWTVATFKCKARHLLHSHTLFRHSLALFFSDHDEQMKFKSLFLFIAFLSFELQLPLLLLLAT